MNLTLTKNKQSKDANTDKNDIHEFLEILNAEIENQITKNYKALEYPKKYKNTAIQKQRYQELNKVASMAIKTFK